MTIYLGSFGANKMTYDLNLLGIIFIIVGAALTLYSIYCLYRLHRYGPYNANLRFQIFHRLIYWPIVFLVSVGIGLITASWIYFIVAFVVWYPVFKFIQIFSAMHFAHRYKRGR